LICCRAGWERVVGRNSEMRAFAEGADRNAGAEGISQDMGRKQGRRRELTSRHGHSSVDCLPK
jgi:hypothetical protein